MITVGKTKLLATQGCWAKTGKRYTATGAVRIDGIDLLPKGGSAARASAAASVSVDTATRIVTSAGYQMSDVVSVTVYMTDLREFPQMNAVYKKFLPDPKPARATVQVAGLVGGPKIEISAIALKH